MTPTDFRRIRRELGQTQSQLADLLGVSSSRTVRKWEQAERDISQPIILFMTLLDQGILTVEAIRKAKQSPHHNNP